MAGDEAAALVVVGSGPAGLEAVRAFRKHGGAGRVVMVSEDPRPPYARPPLSKDFLRGETQDDGLPLEGPSFYADHGLELWLGREAVGLEPGSHTLVLDGGEQVRYQSCVLATGSRPRPLPVPGGDHPDLLLLRSWDHAHRLRDRADSATSAVVVGSGFIGCEAAASLAARGHDVTVVTLEPLPQHARLGPEVAATVAEWLRDDGVRLVTGVEIDAVRDGRIVRLADGRELSGDLVLVAAGVDQEQGWVHASGVACRDGRVEVDASMRTSEPHLLAAGDAALAWNASARRTVAVEHWGDAARMGEVAGTTAAGAADAWAEAPGFWSEIGGRTLKHAAWGDGHDTVRLVAHGGGAFTAWYGSNGTLVGVLTHEADDDYERGRRLVTGGAPFGA